MDKRTQVEEMINRLNTSECKGIMLVDTKKNINLMTCEMVKKLGEGKFGKAFLLKCDEAEYVIKQICSEYMLINNGDNKFYNKYSDEFYKDQEAFATKYPSFVTPNSKNLEKNIKREIEGLELLSDLDLSPKVYDSWICKTSKRPCGYIIMEKLDMTLNDLIFESMKYYYLKNDVEGAIDSIKRIDYLINELADRRRKEKITVADIHTDNVMVKFRENNAEDLFRPDNIVSIKHIDLGYGAFIADTEKEVLNNTKIVSGLFKGFIIWTRLLTYSSSPDFIKFVDKVLERSIGLVYDDLIKEYREWWIDNSKYVEMREEDNIQIEAIKKMYPIQPKKRQVYYDSDDSDDD